MYSLRANPRVSSAKVVDPDSLSIFLSLWGYPALLVLLVLTGVGSPIPEDLLLLTAGYLVFSGVFVWPAALAIGVAGVVISDVMLFSAGRHLAWRSMRGGDNQLLSRERLARASGWFDRVGDRLVFIARLVPGTRAMVFLAAGVRAVPGWRFLRYNLLGAALWVPAMLVVGHASGSRIGNLEAMVAWLSRSAVWVMALAAVLFLMWLSWGREESKL
ncbi:MAG: DedA family protein [Acidobacteriota bacterium]|nr:DedA family protein [Acidobacteriota bacterium]